MDLKVPSDISWTYQPAAMVPEPATPAGTRRRGAGGVVSIAMFDAASDRDWCELVRDIVAVANSGGGSVTIHCRPDEVPSDSACPHTIDLATSDVLHRLAQFTDDSFADIQVTAHDRMTTPTVKIAVGAAQLPIGFTKPAVWRDMNDMAHEHEIFAAGSFYFRHGDRSEPATADDMRKSFDRRLRTFRNQWLREFRRAVNGPAAPSAEATRNTADLANLQPVRIVTDPNAPPLHPQDVDRLYPWRQKDLVHALNDRLGRRTVNSYDVQATRRQHHLDDRPEFVFSLEGTGRRYSPAVADWMIEQFQQDADFFRRARAADHQMMLLRRQKPR